MYDYHNYSSDGAGNTFSDLSGWLKLGWAAAKSAARALAFVLLTSLLASMMWAQNPPPDLTQKSLEDLMNIEVTSVSKKEERLFQTAAAIYVITREDIRRSGLTSIPELLRLAPGLEVARIDGNKWAISARGFNGRVANKLLVLIDDRSVYSPETSGVYWEVQDLPLEDIERIEVIRGPGGTLWGANAVNGVINIITRHAKDTTGGLVTAGSGSEERGFGSFRYGAQLSEKASYRLYGKYFNRRSLLDASGREANDGQQAVRGGGRVDWQLTDRDTLMLEGDAYHTSLRETPLGISAGAPFAPPTNTRGEFNGGSLLGRWTRTFSERSEMALQVYYDRFSRDLSLLADHIDTFDLDFQHRVGWGQRQNIVWGLGYRLNSHQAESDSRAPVQFKPAGKTFQLFSGFAQDEVTLVKDRLRLMFGAKLEHNDFSGFEIQPSIRLSWTPSAQQTLWAAVSRAVRTPARTDQDVRATFRAFPAPDGTPIIVAAIGSTSAKSEVLQAYELGYRLQPGHKFSLDLTTFYNIYDRLQTFEPGAPFFEADPLPHLILPVYYSNLMRGKTYGAEAAANWNVTSHWKLSGSYSFLRMQLYPHATSQAENPKDAEGDNPRHQFQLHSFLKLPHNFEFDASLYRVSAVEIPGYTRLDARLGWWVKEGIELSVGLQNLLTPRHPEFDGNDAVVITSQVKRSIYGKVTWRF